MFPTRSVHMQSCRKCFAPAQSRLRLTGIMALLVKLIPGQMTLTRAPLSGAIYDHSGFSVTGIFASYEQTRRPENLSKIRHVASDKLS